MHAIIIGPRMRRPSTEAIHNNKSMITIPPNVSTIEDTSALPRSDSRNVPVRTNRFTAPPALNGLNHLTASGTETSIRPRAVENSAAISSTTAEPVTIARTLAGLTNSGTDTDAGSCASAAASARDSSRNAADAGGAAIARRDMLLDLRGVVRLERIVGKHRKCEFGRVSHLDSSSDGASAFRNACLPRSNSTPT